MYILQAAMAFLALPLLALAASSTTTTSSASSQTTGTTHNVDVGNGGLVFSPSTVNASVGDQVRFTFYPQNHSVAQATYDAPCQAQDAGIFSGYMPVSSGQGSDDFTITINDTNAIWLYCSYGDHCQDGMVMVINPVSGSSDTNLANFKTKAAKATTNAGPSSDAVSGGIVSLNKNSSSVSSSLSSSKSVSKSSSAEARQSSASSLANAESSGAIVTGGTSTVGSAATANPSVTPSKGTSGVSGIAEGRGWGMTVMGALTGAGFVAWGLI